MDDICNFSEFDRLMAQSNQKVKKEENICLYARISNPSQNIERQVRNLKEKYPNGVVVKETYTGTRLDRPEWEKVMHQVRLKKINTIVFDSVSRMSRSKEEGSKLYLELYKRGVNLIFLKEPHVNTDVYRDALKQKIDVDLNLDDEATAQLMKGIFKSLNGFFCDLATRQVELAFEQSEKEVMDLRQRTKEGLLTARINGKQLGRAKGTKIETKKSIKCKKIIRKRFTAFGGDLNASDCCRLCGTKGKPIARSTFYRYVNAMIEEDSKEKEENKD